tara:strand:- start:914 stop:1846 length:933 start_codon:yes stop_codon:yes gene_type:complete
MADTNLTQLLQVYYNWLYSTNGSLYVLDDKFDTLKDPDYCPKELTASLLGNYLPDAMELVNELNKTQLVVGSSNIRNFITKVKPRFTDLHGTETSIKYFCNTLLGTSFTEIIRYNQTNIGIILYYQDIPTIDLEFLERYLKKYIVPVGIDCNIELAVTNTDLLAGQLRSGESGENRPIYELINKNIPEFNQWEITTFGEGAYDGTGTGEEIAIIGNYFPYLLGTTASIASTAGCSGSTLFNGISGGATGNRNNITTYAFPDWSDAVKISGSSFGLINILDFAFLNAASGNNSPNDGREISGFCPIGGYAP